MYWQKQQGTVRVTWKPASGAATATADTDLGVDRVITLGARGVAVSR